MSASCVSTICFALLTAACVFCAACAKGDVASGNSALNARAPEAAPVLPPPPPEQLTELGRFSPDAALIIVKDLEGYFEDCGCSGSNKGGIARLRSLTLGSPDVTYLFTGFTVLNPSNTVLQRLSQSSTKWILDYAAGVFRLLEHVVLMPSEAELLQLDRLGMLDYYRQLFAEYIVPEGDSVSWNEQEIRIGERHVSVLGQKLPLPLTGSRAREVRVIGFWNVNAPNSEPAAAQYLESLGGLVPHVAASKLARQRVQALLAPSATSVIGSWRAQVPESLPKDPAVTRLLDSLAVNLSHASAPPSTPEQLDGTTASPVEVGPTCGSCHREASDKWRTTRHARALLSLVNVRKQADPRCTPCHTDSTEFESRPEAAYAHGVGCVSCHKNQQTVQLSTCTTCHTEVTDPDERYKLGFKDVCLPGGDSKSMKSTAGTCMLSE